MTLCLLLTALSTATWGQSEAIQNRLNEYFQATEAKDWSKVVDMVYPKLFTQVKKEDMVQMFADMEGNGMEFSMKDFTVNDISEPVTHEGESFALVDYSAGMNIRFTSEA